jgi:hypothetical protein
MEAVSSRARILNCSQSGEDSSFNMNETISAAHNSKVFSKIIKNKFFIWMLKKSYNDQNEHNPITAVH